jgi:CheY-like chemotaxis protein/chromosome segregation ATPase
MAQRRLLLIDSDNHFRDLVAHALHPYGVDVHVVNDGTDGLAQAAELAPELIMIAVDLPDKVGYAICNKAKKGVARSIPVVLATQTVPPADLEQHRRLKVHADGYLDKRTITPEELLEKLDSLIHLGPPVEEVPLDEAEEIALEEDDAIAMEEDVPGDIDSGGFQESSEATNVSQRGAGALIDPHIDAETDAVFAGLVEEPAESYDNADDQPATAVRHAAVTPTAAATDPAAPPADNIDLGLDVVAERAEAEGSSGGRARRDPATQRIGELEAEVQKLQQKLDDSKKTGGSGPASTFSREREFLNLREVINRKEKETIDLREEVDSKDRLILGGKDKIRELEKRLRESDEKLLSLEGNLVTAHETIAALREDKDKAGEREKGLKARIDIAQAQLRKADEDFEGMKRKTAAEMAAARDELGAKKADHEREKRETAHLLEQLKTTHATNLKQAEEERQQSIADLAQQLGEEREAALAALREEHAEAVEQVKQEQLAAIGALRGEHQKQVERLHADRDMALAEAAEDKARALEEAEREKAGALAEAEARRQRDLQDAEAQREADLAAAEARRQKDLQTKLAEYERAAADTAAIHQVELDEERSQAQAALEQAQSDARSTLDKAQADARAALHTTEERARHELATARQQHERAMAELEDRHTNELGVLTKSNEDSRAALIEAYEATKAELEQELTKLEQGLAQSRDRVRALEGELGRTVQAVKDRDDRLAGLEHEVSERDARLAAQKGEIDQLEKDNAGLQEQLLKAYQKLKADEAVVNKAKKAMAIALTLLDGEQKSDTASG